MAPTLLIGVALACGLVLIGTGLWSERRARPASISSTPLPTAQAAPPRRTLPSPADAARRFAQVAARHPVPAFGLLETGSWLLVLLTLADHLLGPRSSTSAQIAWYLTIGIHELGHVLCVPFGWFLYVAGGSIWQILFWALLALYTFLVRRQITFSLLMWTITGHSFISLALYIGDARARALPLLFGASKDHHDWWNLLKQYGLLDYDHALALAARLTGAALILAAVGMGILTAWALPRTKIGPSPRFSGRFFPALRVALKGPEEPLPFPLDERSDQ